MAETGPELLRVIAIIHKELPSPFDLSRCDCFVCRIWNRAFDVLNLMVRAFKEKRLLSAIPQPLDARFRTTLSVIAVLLIAVENKQPLPSSPGEDETGQGGPDSKAKEREQWDFAGEKIRDFHEFLRTGMLVHPHRRSWGISGILSLGETVGTDLPSIITTATKRVETLNSDTLNQDESLVQDPDLRPPEIFDVFLTLAGPHDHPSEQFCTICSNPYYSNVSGNNKMKTLCNHVLCRTCIDRARRSGEAVYNCPFCTACLVCGKKDCKFHVVKGEPTTPVPILDVLQLIKGPQGPGSPLKGYCIFRDSLWRFREASREERVRLAALENTLRSQLLIKDRIRSERRRTVKLKRIEDCFDACRDYDAVRGG
ncbi:hypothetical protein BDV96DRAFT_662099 [Lophiotrema nucula]|uniref:RING-type domain-containing protein n=1 Tax=Lophiotrema nucula TaxID=690887 RepID=A0A6A5Z324_9PLEO|nr:hypothetical protein BDV96DRAFT_662099 [Lophiotrema nucula]